MKPISLVDCVFPPLPSEDIFFSLCKGKSLFPNGLGIQYGFREIFLSLQERVFDVIRTKASDCLSSSSTFVWHREKKSPDGKELKSSKPKGKKLNFKTFIVMIYSNFTGRVAKKAKLIDGVNGQFLSMDMAVNDFSKGEEVTQWVRVQTSDPAHLKLAEYFTKGRILTIQGNIKIDQWEGKDGTPHAQLRVHAKYIDFLNIGKKPVSDTNVPDAPTDTPKEKKDDLPF